MPASIASLAVLVLLLCGCLAFSASAEPSPDAAPGVAAYEAGDYERAYELLQPAADAGVPEARYLLARLMAGELPEALDYEKAIALLTKDARCIDGSSLNLYAFLKSRNSSVHEVDTLNILKLYKEAAEMGSAKAMANIGYLINDRLEDPWLAGSYIYNAAALGEERAKRALAEIERGALGGRALERIAEIVEGQPIEQRWPPLNNSERECS